MYGFIFNVPNVPLSSLKILEGELPVQKGTDPFCTKCNRIAAHICCSVDTSVLTFVTKE